MNNTYIKFINKIRKIRLILIYRAPASYVYVCVKYKQRSNIHMYVREREKQQNRVKTLKQKHVTNTAKQKLCVFFFIILLFGKLDLTIC